MNTAARVNTSRDAHWYTKTGEPCYEIMGKTTGRPRPVNIGDARKQGLVPGVTTVLRVINKPELEAWKIEQAVLAVLTTPRQPGEADDTFVDRVLRVEKVQDQERDAAADKGRAIHDALEAHFKGEIVDPQWHEWIKPAAEAISVYGKVIASEKVLACNSYAGRTDLILESDVCYWIFDHKSTKRLPEKGAWDEHVLQAAAYAKAFVESPGDPKPVRTANCYVSTTETGKFVIWQHPVEWHVAYNAFEHCLSLWRFLNKFNQ